MSVYIQGKPLSSDWSVQIEKVLVFLSSLRTTLSSHPIPTHYLWVFWAYWESSGFDAMQSAEQGYINIWFSNLHLRAPCWKTQPASEPASCGLHDEGRFPRSKITKDWQADEGVGGYHLLQSDRLEFSADGNWWSVSCVSDLAQRMFASHSSSVTLSGKACVMLASAVTCLTTSSSQSSWMTRAGRKQQEAHIKVL